MDALKCSSISCFGMESFITDIPWSQYAHFVPTGDVHDLLRKLSHSRTVPLLACSHSGPMNLPLHNGPTSKSRGEGSPAPIA